VPELAPRAARNAIWSARLAARRQSLVDAPNLRVEGLLKRMVGLTLEAVGCHAEVGSRCDVVAPDGRRVEAEVVGFAGDRLYLMPTGSLVGIGPNARVVPTLTGYEGLAGDALLGRVLDGAGRPLDELGPIEATERVRLAGTPINPLARRAIVEPLDVGVRSINALLTVGRGQRIGLFAGSGVGKSRLLGMMTRYTNAEVVVVGLIGERGREVNEFVQTALGAEGLRRAIVVATPADHPPLMRLHGAFLATALAEYFRDRGQRVLLLMDSLTRFAQAQREIALAIGEPPATKGYPPSVFARMPQLVERAGNGRHPRGSMTAFYTVLAEGDDPNDPIVDASRAILDGHIVLSRDLAESGVYPAVDIEASISRCFTEITDQTQQALVRRFRQLYAAYRRNEDLISVGAYRKGSDPRVDEAIAYWPRIRAFLAQDLHEPVSFTQSVQSLQTLLGSEQGQTQL
jgi:flagellum-specific ATP synthase